MSAIVESALLQDKRLCSSPSFWGNVYRLSFFLCLGEEIDSVFLRNIKRVRSGFCVRDKVCMLGGSMHSSVWERAKLFRQEY